MSNRRLVYCFHLIGVFCLTSLLLSAQHADPSRVVPEKREAWIQNTIQQLRKIRPDTVSNRIAVEQKSFDDYFRLSVRINKEGLINLPEREWIYIITSSAHDNPETGDISLAIDRHGRLYQNNGHVCGGIITFETDKIKKVKSSRQFFKHFVSDTDGEKWKKIK